ncbi:hypothetical protein EMPG_13103, partial [Blastomyces silverae]
AEAVIDVCKNQDKIVQVVKAELISTSSDSKAFFKITAHTDEQIDLQKHLHDKITAVKEAIAHTVNTANSSLLFSSDVDVTISENCQKTLTLIM